MKKISGIYIVLFVIVVAFIGCYTWGVVRMGDERSDESLIYFKDAAIGDRTYLNGRVNSMSSSYGIVHTNISLLGDYPRPLQVNIYSTQDYGIKEGDDVYVIGAKTNSNEMIAYTMTIKNRNDVNT